MIQEPEEKEQFCRMPFKCLVNPPLRLSRSQKPKLAWPGPRFSSFSGRTRTRCCGCKRQCGTRYTTAYAAHQEEAPEEAPEEEEDPCEIYDWRASCSG